MSRKYKFTKDTDNLFFVTMTVVYWIDLFIRQEYREIFLDSVRYCQEQKDLVVYAWVIMPSHIHMIVGSRGKPFSDIFRDLKRHTSQSLHKAIKEHPQESRREWLIWMMERAGKKHGNKFQLWQPENHPIILDTNEILDQKLSYIHYNPVESGFVNLPQEWKFSSASDYVNEEKGILDICFISPSLITIIT
jgi:putative transposase